MVTSTKTDGPGDATEESAPPQSAAHRERAEHILDTAATLLVRWGFRKTTVDDVARAAGVAKGTIYVHWKDKNELFRAALMRAQQQANAEVRQRIAADPEGGLPHRLWTHGMLAALANPLTAAVLKGQTDLFHGLRGAFEPTTVQQMLGDYEAYIVQLQEAGLIRADLPVSTITFVTSALKIGIINTPDLFGAGQTPSLEELTEAISDLIRRWLEPDHAPGDQEAGKRFAAEWLEKLQEIEQDLQQTEKAP
ncbi:MAG TPA: TetR/AcrR family transcriptional regulator [Chloroflexia bacterium]|nr:TetR/AcrR family transcriptional regulator [Chloroflexia bacterium]